MEAATVRERLAVLEPDCARLGRSALPYETERVVSR